MNTQEQRLLRWADALESGRYQQIKGTFFGDWDGGDAPRPACALGCGILAVGEFWSASLPLPIILDPDSRGNAKPIREAIVAEVERFTGRQFAVRSISALNDAHGVTFPEFARAIRAVVRQHQEHGTWGRSEGGSYEPLALGTREGVTV